MTPLRLRSMLHMPFDKAPWDDVLGDDCHIRIANDPPAVGKSEALAALSAFRDRINGFGLFIDLWRSREAIFAETEVIIRRPHGGTVAIPCTIVARTMSGLVRDLRIHLDPTAIH